MSAPITCARFTKVADTPSAVQSLYCRISYRSAACLSLWPASSSPSTPAKTTFDGGSGNCGGIDLACRQSVDVYGCEAGRGQVDHPPILALDNAVLLGGGVTH